MKIPKQIMSKQIRLKCLDCAGDNSDEVKFCTCSDCPLWYFRFGIYPKTFIRRHGEKSAVLFNPDAFKEGGILAPTKTVSEFRKVYRGLLSTSEHIHSEHKKK